MLLVAGAVAVTSAHLSRIRLLDVADGAALSAANALDDAAYAQGLGESVPLSNPRCRNGPRGTSAAGRGRGGILAWRLAPGTGTPDGRTAVVVVVGEAELPMVGPALRDLGRLGDDLGGLPRPVRPAALSDDTHGRPHLRATYRRRTATL